MRTFIAYALALTVAPFLGVILSLLPGMLILSAFGRVERQSVLRWVAMVLTTVPAGLLIGWLGMVMAGWLGVPATRTMFVAQGIFIFVAAITRSRQGIPNAGAHGTGQIIGLILDGLWLL